MPFTYIPSEKPRVVNIAKVLTKNKIQVVVEYDKDNEIIAWTDRNDRRISINGNCSYVNQYENYVIAHMIGHLSKHSNDFKDTITCFDPIKTYWVKNECQAHAFALSLLMPPREALRYGKLIASEFYERFSEKISKNVFLQIMAESFKIPANWIETRFRTFEL